MNRPRRGITMIDFKNKVVIITGATGSIGKEITKALIDLDAIVYCIIRNKSKSQGIDDDHILCGDIRDDKFRKKSIQYIMEREKSISSLVNCVGVTGESWKNTIDINLTCVFEITKLVLDEMKKNNTGSIVNLTSINSEQAFSNNPSYVASKGGLKMLTKSFALDYGKYGIRVNNVCLGYIVSDMTKNSYLDSERNTLIKNRTILNRWGMPEDVVGPVLFLLSDMSKYVTAADIVVDGGWLAKGI